MSFGRLLIHFIWNIDFSGTNNNVSSLPTLTVKKEPEEISSTSQQEQTQQIHIQQPQTISVSVASNQGATHSIVDTSNPNANQQHIVTQHDNSDGSTSLQIAQVQNLPATHQLTLSNLNQVNLRMKMNFGFFN